MSPSPNHPAGSKLHWCRCCAARRIKQALRPGGVGNTVLACPTCDPNLFDPKLSRKATP